MLASIGIRRGLQAIFFSFSFVFFFLFLVVLPATLVSYLLMFVVNYAFHTTLPYWAFLPVGLCAVALYTAIANLGRPRS